MELVCGLLDASQLESDIEKLKFQLYTLHQDMRLDAKYCMNLLLLLLSRFSRVQLCVTPQTAAHQAPRPWDSPGKNTGVGCHFLLQCMKVNSESEVAQSCPIPRHWTVAHQAPPSMGFPRQEYWSGLPLPSPKQPTVLLKVCPLERCCCC